MHNQNRPDYVVIQNFYTSNCLLNHQRIECKNFDIPLVLWNKYSLTAHLSNSESLSKRPTKAGGSC